MGSETEDERLRGFVLGKGGMLEWGWDRGAVRCCCVSGLCLHGMEWWGGGVVVHRCAYSDANWSCCCT